MVVEPMDGEWIVVYSDGACRGNGKPGSIAGIGVWYGHNDPRNISERCPGDQTNNRAELIAIIRVLETEPHSNFGILIRTDSSYSLSCVTKWIQNWRAKGWKTADGKPVKNRDVIEYLSALLSHRAARGQPVKLEYVKGHAGIEGNEGADRLAVRGCLGAEVGERAWRRRMAILEATEEVVMRDKLKGKGKATDVQSEAGKGMEKGKGKVDVEIPQEDLLSEEELRVMEAAGDFDDTSF